MCTGSFLRGGLGLLLWVAACGNAPAPSPSADPAAPTLQTVRLALNWVPEPEFGGFYEGVLGGHYAAEGFKVEIVPGGPGAPTLELLASGQAEVAITAADDLLLKRSKGAGAVGVWAAFQDTPQGLIVHEASPVRALEDIPAGAEVAIEVGGPFHSFLAKRMGWEGKVKAVPYGGSVGPFLADPNAIQQAYITSEPCVAEAKGARVRFLAPGTQGWNPYGTVVAVADPPPPWTDRFVAATQRAWEAYLRDPQRANAEILKKNDQMDATLISCVTARQAPFVTGTDGLGAMRAERWEAVARALVEVGLLPAGSTAAGAWKAPAPVPPVTSGASAP